MTETKTESLEIEVEPHHRLKVGKVMVTNKLYTMNGEPVPDGEFTYIDETIIRQVKL